MDLPEGWRSLSGNGLDYWALVPGRLSAREQLWLAETVSQIFWKACWPQGNSRLQPPPPDKVLQRLLEMELVVLGCVKGERESVLAYSVFASAEFGGRKLVYIDSTAVAPSFQASGTATVLLELGFRELGAENVAFRTQNPATIKLLQKFRPGEILPVTADFDARTLPLLSFVERRFLETHALKGSSLGPGVYLHVYSWGRLGDYRLRLEDPQIARLEERLLSLGLDRDRGGAVVVLALGLRGKA